MKIVVIDTETTGIFDFKQPADGPRQPRMAQFAGLKLDTGWPDQVERFSAYVRPDGWTMPAEAAAVNGLTTEMLIEQGRPVADVLDWYAAAVEAGYIVVAYNAQFDLKVMRAELRRAGRDDMFERTPNICVMRPMTEICRIPSPRGGFKWPKLEQACAHLGITNANAHDALGDAEAALAVFFALASMSRLPEPAVHFAKQATAGAEVF